MTYRLATGNVGVMAAQNEEVKAKEFVILGWVFAAVTIMCLVNFRSVIGTIMVIVPLALVSILVYAVMAFVGIGLKVNTLPMVALGAGIGVDYGIYLFSRMQEFLDRGHNVHYSYLAALRVTGAAIFFTGVTLAIGVATWVFSPLKFQADVGLMLTFMFLVNMLGAMLLLPALGAWLLPRPAEPAACSAPQSKAGRPRNRLRCPCAGACPRAAAPSPPGRAASSCAASARGGPGRSAARAARSRRGGSLPGRDGDAPRSRSRRAG